MTTLDGFQIYGFFRSGARRIDAARKYLDRINVFPVADGDTGTNLSATLAGAVTSTVPAASASLTLERLADATMVSARGNSGVIFAQFVLGLSEAIRTAELRSYDFVVAVRVAAGRAKSAVTNPREGTILSIIETWAILLARKISDTISFLDLIGATRNELKRTLSQTTEQLAALKSAGVVDAGAAGFVEFVEGAYEFLSNGPEPYEKPGTDPLEFDTSGPDLNFDRQSTPPVYRYCTEAIVSGNIVDAETVRATVEGLGDSLIVAGNRKRVKVHIHTDHPDLVMTSLEASGSVTGQKVDDMTSQFNDVHKRGARVAIVTDSSCDLPAQLMDHFRVHAVPLLITVNGGEYLDKLTLDAPRLRAFSEGKGEFPRTSQPPAHFFSRLYKFLAGSYDAVVAIHLSGAMSGTFSTSEREAARTAGKVTAFDSKQLSSSLGLVTLRAAEAAENGWTREQILAVLPQWSHKARIFVSVTNLRYMVKGGRVSPLKGQIARLLNLKPIVSVDESGNSTLHGRAFSEEANLRTLVRMAVSVHRQAPLRHYAIGHAGAPAKAAQLAATLERELGFPPLYVMEISAVVALNAGPGAVSVATMSE
ncbi:MAG TPA: DegV family protein [Spirochaetia bacterium]|nr:DegV family protein [Spirochaetia bacterium]